MYSFPIRIRPKKIVFRGTMLMRFLFPWESNMNIGVKHQITYLRQGKIRAESLVTGNEAGLPCHQIWPNRHSLSQPPTLDGHLTCVLANQSGRGLK